MQEKRISVRTHLMGVGARVSKDGKAWTDVEVKDISDGGMRFSSSEEHPKGTILKFHGDISDFLKVMEIDCDLKVVFAQPGEDGDCFISGCKFLCLPKEKQTELSVFIEKLVTRYPILLLQ